ncbi:MAG: hypothetical protein WAU68_10870 [Vitreimonas sp.]
MRLTILTARLPRMPFPTLEDIGAAMMAVPSPSGHTFESFMPKFEEEKPDTEARH